MIEFESLEEHDKECVISRGRAWRATYKTHVAKLVSGDGPCYPPSGSDLFHPELWKSAHWRWLKKVIVERRSEKTALIKMNVYVTERCYQWLTRNKGKHGTTRNKIIQTILEVAVSRAEEIEREIVRRK